MPKLDGHSLLVRYRERGYATPVLILSARDEKESVIRLLNAGADDYLAKPFDLGEFLARAKALVRRGTGQRSPVLTMEDLRMDTVERSVQRGEREIALSPMEYRVLEYLAHRPARSFPRRNFSNTSTTTTGKNSATSSKSTSPACAEKLTLPIP